MALLISIGNMGGIVGSNIFVSWEAPKYPAGFGTGFAICCIAVLMAIFLRFIFARENARKVAVLEREGEEAFRARYTEQEMVQMGDKSPFFIYTL